MVLPCNPKPALSQAAVGRDWNSSSASAVALAGWHEQERVLRCLTVLVLLSGCSERVSAALFLSQWI